MFLSESGKDAIKAFEGLYLSAYRCPAGVWTIGWGCTEGVHEGQTISMDTAEQLLNHELTKFESAVNRLVEVPLSQNQFDALVSFSFNCGVGALERSTLLKKLNAGNYASVPSELARWTHGGGKVLPGLVKRRRIEAQMWTSPGTVVQPIDEPMAQKVSEAPPSGETNMLQALLSIGLAVLGAGATQDAPQQKTGAGVTVPTTITVTNYVQGLIGAVIAAIGVQSFGADTLHTMGAIGGAVVAVSALLNNLHILNATNANTIAAIGQLLAQVGAQAQDGAKDASAKPQD